MIKSSLAVAAVLAFCGEVSARTVSEGTTVLTDVPTLAAVEIPDLGEFDVDDLEDLDVDTLFEVSDETQPGTPWQTSATAELRYFPEAPVDPRQLDHINLSLALESEYFKSWDARQRFVFSPFFRLDQHDHRRTHFDIRELAWSRIGDGWEFHLGFRKVFWGVTESQHLVDIINQTDLIENPDGEEKLGQPMLNLSLVRDWGKLDFFMLPYFRERTFPGPDGRLRFELPVDTDRPIYESGAGRWHTDLAVRYFKTFGPLDLGLYHFYGTSRDPLFEPDVSPVGELRLRPRYDIIHQSGLDAQLTRGNWLLKLEAIWRNGQADSFGAVTAGLEYVVSRLSTVDLSLFFEYLYSDSDRIEITPFKDDLFVGVNLGLNDIQSTEFRMGALIDRESDRKIFTFEASRRVGSDHILRLEAVVFDEVNPDSIFFGLRNDSYLQLEFTRFF